jgi:hypothetical protein
MLTVSHDCFISSPHVSGEVGDVSMGSVAAMWISSRIEQQSHVGRVKVVFLFD